MEINHAPIQAPRQIFQLCGVLHALYAHTFCLMILLLKDIIPVHSELLTFCLSCAYS